MATVVSIISSNDVNIRQKTLPGTITKTNDADMRDVVAGELRDRGVLQSASTAALSGHTRLNTKLVVVHNVGVFVPLETGDAADGVTTFASADAGWLWQMVLDVSGGSGADRFTIDGDDTYTLQDGFMIDKILIKPTVEETAKVGLTDGGDEILLEDVLAADTWRSVSMDIFADGGDVTIYFGGFTDDTSIIIYKRKL